MTSAMPLFRLGAKIAFVTGTATGLGASIAAGLAQQGADVLLSDKSRVDSFPDSDAGGNLIGGLSPSRWMSRRQACHAGRRNGSRVLASEQGGIVHCHTLAVDPG